MAAVEDQVLVVNCLVGAETVVDFEVEYGSLQAVVAAEQMDGEKGWLLRMAAVSFRLEIAAERHIEGRHTVVVPAIVAAVHLGGNLGKLGLGHVDRESWHYHKWVDTNIAYQETEHCSLVVGTGELGNFVPAHYSQQLL